MHIVRELILWCPLRTEAQSPNNFFICQGLTVHNYQRQHMATQKDIAERQVALLVCHVTRDIKLTQTAHPSGLVRQTISGLGLTQSAHVRINSYWIIECLRFGPGNLSLFIMPLSLNFTLVIDCGDPGTPWHGYLHGSFFKYNNTVTFSCRPQHHLEGDQQRTCQADGQWSGLEPKCLGTARQFTLVASLMKSIKRGSC